MIEGMATCRLGRASRIVDMPQWIEHICEKMWLPLSCLTSPRCGCSFVDSSYIDISSYIDQEHGMKLNQTWEWNWGGRQPGRCSSGQLPPPPRLW